MTFWSIVLAIVVAKLIVAVPMGILSSIAESYNKK